MSTEPDAFDSAEFYSCREDNELLTLESPDEAVTMWLDERLERGIDVATIIRKRAPVTVYAFSRREVSDDWIESQAEWLLDRAAEAWAEEFGDPDTRDGDGIDDDAVKAALPAAKAAIKQLVEHGNVWTCEQVASRTYDADQVTAMMRERRSEWFETGEGEE